MFEKPVFSKHELRVTACGATTGESSDNIPTVRQEILKGGILEWGTKAKESLVA